MTHNRLRTTLLVILYALGAALLVAFIVVIATTLSLVSTVREAQVNNKPTIDAAARAAKAAEAGTKIIRDCTTPGQRCYQDGQRRTAAAVGDLNRVIVFAAACADRPGGQTVVEIQSCVIEKLAQQQSGEKP